MFRKELPDQHPAPGAERSADDDFTFAGQAARQREIGEVGASDQEDEACRHHQHQERPAHVRSNERLGIALHDHAPAFVRRWKLRGDPSADRAHGRSRLVNGDTLFQPPERHEPVKVTRHVRPLERQRPPDLREGTIERATPRQHADHRVRLVVEQDRPIHDTGIRAELADPERVAEDHDTMFAELILAGRERPPESGFDAEDAKVVGRDARAAQQHRLADARQRGASARLRREEVEHRVVALPIEEVERRDRVPFAFRRLFHHAHDAVRIPIGEGLQQHPVDEAEDRGVGANADRQRQQRD